MVDDDQEGLISVQTECLVLNCDRSTSLTDDPQVASDRNPESLRDACVRSYRIQVCSPLALVEVTITRRGTR